MSTMIKEHQARTAFSLAMDDARQHLKKGAPFYQNALMAASKAVGIATVINDDELMREAASFALSLTRTSTLPRDNA